MQITLAHHRFKILVIQTAFIGDNILATAALESLHAAYPDAAIHLLVRQGNEGLFIGHPYLAKCWVWQKKGKKLLSLYQLALDLRSENFTWVINLQRHLGTGLLALSTGAPVIAGFKQNPMAGWFTHSIKHDTSGKYHEVDRNLNLMRQFSPNLPAALPRLYPGAAPDKVKAISTPYITVSPASVWFTKALPKEQWISFLKAIDTPLQVVLLGSASDATLCQSIIDQAANTKLVYQNRAGKQSLLASAGIMTNAVANFVCDSAPMHLASAVNAPTVAVYCSTLPSFGFGPLANTKFIIETTEDVPCRPCGLHGYSACPEKHFRCATTITTKQLLAGLNGCLSVISI